MLMKQLPAAMRWVQLLACIVLVTAVQAYAPIQWMKNPASGLVLTPKGFPGNAKVRGPPQKLTIEHPRGNLLSRIPRFTVRPDHTLTWDDAGFCVEADAERSGSSVHVNYCTGGPSQKWSWVSDDRGYNMIQLQDTNMCLDVSDEGRELNGAPIVLHNCQSNELGLWRFEPEGPFPASLEGSSLSSEVRYVVASLIALGGLCTLSLSVLLWRWQARPRALAVDQGGTALRIDLECGVSLSGMRAHADNSWLGNRVSTINMMEERAGVATAAPVMQRTIRFKEIGDAQRASTYSATVVPARTLGSPAIILLPPIGVGIDRTFCGRFIDEWAKHEEASAALYVLDLMGMGDSSPKPQMKRPFGGWREPPRTPRDYALQIIRFIESQELAESEVVLAASSNLITAVLEAVEIDSSHAIKGIIFINPVAVEAISSDRPQKSIDRVWKLAGSPAGAALFRWARRKAFLSSFSKKNLFADPSQVDDEYLEMCRQGAVDTSTRHAVFSFLAGTWRKDYREVLSAISLPTLIISGQDVGGSYIKGQAKPVGVEDVDQTSRRGLLRWLLVWKKDQDQGRFEQVSRDLGLNAQLKLRDWVSAMPIADAEGNVETALLPGWNALLYENPQQLAASISEFVGRRFGTTVGLDSSDPVHPYKRTLYIMRGVSACGKSTIARRILKKHLMANGISGQLADIAPLSRGFILSTDDFMTHIDEDTGAETTTYDVKTIHRNHDLNRSRCEAAMKLGITPLIVDNTNTEAWEMRRYVELAHAHGYDIIIKDAMALQDITLDVIKKRLPAIVSATGKDVPIKTIKSMMKRYEILPSNVDDAVAFILSAADPGLRSSSQPATKPDVTDNPKQILMPQLVSQASKQFEERIEELQKRGQQLQEDAITFARHQPDTTGNEGQQHQKKVAAKSLRKKRKNNPKQRVWRFGQLPA